MDAGLALQAVGAHAAVLDVPAQLLGQRVRRLGMCDSLGHCATPFRLLFSPRAWFPALSDKMSSPLRSLSVALVVPEGVRQLVDAVADVVGHAPPIAVLALDIGQEPKTQWNT